MRPSFSQTLFSILFQIYTADIILIDNIQFHGAWIGGYWVEGVQGERESGGGICVLLSARLSKSNHSEDILGSYMSTTSSSTLIHHVLRSSVRRWSKYIGRISYSASQSTLTRRSLALCCTRDMRSATRVWVSDLSLS